MQYVILGQEKKKDFILKAINRTINRFLNTIYRSWTPYYQIQT